MCEAKPGTRCAGDTCGAAQTTDATYRDTHPDGPDVSPLPIAEAMTDKPWDSLEDDTAPVPLSELGIVPGDSHMVTAHELGDHILQRMEIVKDDEGNFRVEGIVTLNVRQQLCDAAGIDGDDDTRDAWLNARGPQIEAYLSERYGLERLDGDDWDYQEAVLVRELEPDADTADAYGDLYDKTKMVDLHNETDAGTFGSPYVYRQLAEHLTRLDDINSSTDGAQLRRTLLDQHLRSVRTATPDDEAVGLRIENKAIVKRLETLPNKWADVRTADALRPGDVATVTADGKTLDFVVQRVDTSDIGDPAYRTTASLGLIGGRGYSVTLRTPDIGPNAPRRQYVKRIDTTNS